MKLLLDENLSRRLVPFLQSNFPGSSHVALLGLEQASDRAIWEYARDHDFVIVTRDADFSEMSALLPAAQMGNSLCLECFANGPTP
jgi:predicted nuclease of predicted toxin-antitoxin system